MKFSSSLSYMEIAYLINSMEIAVKAFSELVTCPAPEKIGGVLTVLDSVTGMPLLIVPIGKLDEEKVEKYFNLSLEKAKRVFSTGLMSSWATRDPEASKWGGAIRCQRFIFSFSGLPEVGDESVCIAVAFWYNFINLGEIDKITAISGQSFYDAVYTHVKHG